MSRISQNKLVLTTLSYKITHRATLASFIKAWLPSRYIN
ncbi:hypothetical protein PPIS_a3058 [Pseudoalteromonas piscicida]|uniref:Uncharacterized protein n=1 Tax=Pseudoalteromonas piscicida TaxID=43662 RepID=A0ABN5CKU4_PSEO7|nr:hypothetical protein PPIS_a3058 [Pseudoalteromonas piscicida]